MVQKDYLKIAKAKVTRPSKNPEFAQRRRVLVYGRKKHGKTRFATSAGIEETLVIDPEGGTDTMLKLDPYVWQVRNWAEVNEAYMALRTGKLSPALLGLGPSKEPFKYVAFDGMTKIAKFANAFVRKQAEAKDLERQPGTMSQRDYGRAGELLMEFMTKVDALKMGVIYTAHERMISGNDDEDDAETDLRVVDLPQQVRGFLNGIVDVIGRIYVQKVNVRVGGKGGKVEERNQRRLWIGLHPRYDTGFRSDWELPDMVKQPTYPKLINLMLTGKEGNE